MLGKDHATSGALAFAAAAPLFHVSPAGLAAGVVLTAGAALLPDIDEPGATISRQGGFATRTLAVVVRRVSGGHRKGSHSLIGLAVFTLAAWVAVLCDGSWPGRVVLGLFLGLLFAAAAHALRIGRHRLGGHHGDVLGLAAAAVMVYWHAGLWLVPACVALGGLAHVAGDMLTHHGCPVAYPFSRRDFGLLPASLRISTGKLAETWIVSPLLLAALGFLLWRDTGAMHLAAHARAAIGAP